MRSLILFFIVFITSCIHCQDTLYLINKDRITIQLLEVNPTNLKYKRTDNQSGPTYTVLKEEVIKVVYANGKSDVFNMPTIPLTSDSTQKTAKPITENKAYDTLYFKSGIKTPAKIYELTDENVKYKPLKNPDGPLYTISKSDLKEVIFSTGLKQTFNVQPVNPAVSPNSETDAITFQLRGARDAKKYYKNKGGSIGTGITAFVFPLAGLVPAIICSSIAPKERNLGYPYESLWENKYYRLGYSKEAYRIKKKRVWTGFGIGTGAAILLGILVSQ
ncbi:MAG: hypothetical protein JWO32_2517 [Bacteroidetes bacterium]|nr:hypothetical protein [Bacteroidota bacterium]